ncbi:hypothetical protein DMP17_11315 [Pseudonocardia sp. TMWB2A]
MIDVPGSSSGPSPGSGIAFPAARALAAALLTGLDVGSGAGSGGCSGSGSAVLSSGAGGVSTSGTSTSGEAARFWREAALAGFLPRPRPVISGNLPRRAQIRARSG